MDGEAKISNTESIEQLQLPGRFVTGTERDACSTKLCTATVADTQGLNGADGESCDEGLPICENENVQEERAADTDSNEVDETQEGRTVDNHEDVDCISEVKLQLDEGAEILDCSAKNLKVVPSPLLKNGENLQFLYLEANEMKDLPEEFFPSLPSLRWLDLRRNELETLPASIAGHGSLEVVLLQRNKIRRVPLELGLVPTLRGVQLLENPVEFPPPSVLGGGVPSLLRFLREEWEKAHSGSGSDVAFGHKMALGKLHDVMKDKGVALAMQWMDDGQLTNVPWSPGLVDFQARVEQKVIEEQETEEIRTEKERQEAILQRARDEEVLKEWRKDLKKRSLFASSKYTKDLLKSTPYFLDADYLNLPTRSDLRQAVDEKSTRRSERQRESWETKERTDPEELNRIFRRLERMGQVRRERSFSPEHERQLLASEIEEIQNIQKSLQAKRSKWLDVYDFPKPGKPFVIPTF